MPIWVAAILFLCGIIGALIILKHQRKSGVKSHVGVIFLLFVLSMLSLLYLMMNWVLFNHIA